MFLSCKRYFPYKTKNQPCMIKVKKNLKKTMKRMEQREAVTIENKGMKMFGIIHRPLSVGKAPAILFCHGFAGNKCGKYRSYVILAQKLAEAGFVVFRFDYRGSGDSEGDFSDMTIEGEVSDTMAALDYLSTLPFVDPGRIGILGRSLGGAVATIAAERSNKIKSIVLWSAVFNSTPWREKWDLLKKEKAQNTEKEKANHVLMFGFFPSYQFLEEFFLMNVEKSLKHLENVPFLNIHGEKDSTVKINHQNEYKKTREKASAKSNFIKLPKSDHEFHIAEEQKKAIEDTTRWFIETLK